MMRKLTLFMVLSIDGFVCGENDELDWEIKDEAVSRHLIPTLIEDTDTVLLGRVLYQGFEQYWPGIASDASADPDLRSFAQWLEATPKLVFSGTIEKPTWQNTNAVAVRTADDIARAVNDQKALTSKNIVSFGGAQFAQTLVALGLVDEFIFKMQPIALGKGKALFTDITQRNKLELLEAKSFDSGVISLRYKNASAKA
jgi:dihydrofolate reductase